MVLYRYEDFIADKIGFIHTLARGLGMNPIHDIQSRVDIQFQPKGDHSVTWKEFFGCDNLARIEKICAEGMAQMGYQASPPDMAETP
jgi:hypothetical protein